MTAAQAQADRRDLEQQLRQLDADTERLDGALKAADELIAQGSALKAEVVGIEVPDADLQGLRGIESQRASLRAQLRPWPRGCRTDWSRARGRCWTAANWRSTGNCC